MVSSGNFLTSAIGGGSRRVLDADQLMASALSRARRSDFSDYSFVDPLNRLLKAYDSEAELSPFGRYAVRWDVMRCLKNFLRLDKGEDENPGLTSRPIS